MDYMASFMRSGIYVVVVHFDHLFHRFGPGGSMELYAELDMGRIRARVDRFFRTIKTARALYRLRSTTFEAANKMLSNGNS